MKAVQKPISGEEEKETLTPPVEALSNFYEAFNNRDLEKMARNWAQTDDISMDNPLGGITRGWSEIKAVYGQIFRGPAKVKVEFFDYALHQTEEIFYAVGRERGEFCLSNTIIKLAIRTTRIYCLMDGTWRQVHHHGSIDDPELLTRYQKAVR